MFKLCKYNKPLNPLIVICHKIHLSKKQNNDLTFTFYFAVYELISVKKKKIRRNYWNRLNFSDKDTIPQKRYNSNFQEKHTIPRDNQHVNTLTLTT